MEHTVYMVTHREQDTVREYTFQTEEAAAKAVEKLNREAVRLFALDGLLRVVFRDYQGMAAS
ncbi:MAG: hypothetical protein ACPGYT_11735 [Nitrospirales bacterium]